MDISNNPLSRDSGFRKSTGIVLAALLIFGAVSAVMTYSIRDAYAAVSITTSANQFFGNSFAQVIIDDSARNSASTTKETVSATVRVLDNTGAEKVTGTINAREIGTNSGQFEFFITTANGTAFPFNPRSETTAGNVALLRANVGASGTVGNGTTLNTVTQPANNWKFVIEYGGLQKEVQYKSSSASFNLDRTTVGSNNNAIVIATDQDANVDPTRADTIRAQANTGNVYVDRDGDGNIDVGFDPVLLAGSFTAGNFNLTETGANTGIFERTFNVTAFTTSSTSTYTFTNFDVYGPTPDNDTAYKVTPTTTKIDRSLIRQNVDGSITPITNITTGSEIPITLTDADQNKNTRSEDTVAGVLVVSVDGGDSETVDLSETGASTGIFKANLNNGLLPVTFMSSAATATANNGILELTTANIEDNDDIVITYTDPVNNAGQSATTATLRMALSHVAGSLAFDASKAQSTDKVGLTLTDLDLNNNPNAIDSFTVTTASTARTYNMTVGNTVYNNVAQFTIKIKGSSTLTPEAADTITFVETGANTGVFRGQLDISKIDVGTGNTAVTLNDGDQIELTYEDNLEDPDSSSTATLTIGKASTSVSVDKTTTGFPTTLADGVKVRLTVTDPSRNTNNGIQDTISSAVIDANSTTFDIAAIHSDGSTALNIGSTDNAGRDLVYTPFTLRETGSNTGVFTGQVTIGKGTGGTFNELDNAKLKFVYDGGAVTVTMRPSDMVLSADKTSVQNGENIKVRLNDPDRNRDPEIKDRVTFSIATQNDAITAANLGALTSVTAEETGVNTGVFEKTLTLGSDIRVTLFNPSSSITSITQARELRISATEAIATDLTAPTRDLTVGVRTTTGKISVSPEIIGPGTEMTIMVEDKDLTANPSGTEVISPLSTLELLSITTDRTGFGVVKPGLEETGPNTGIFRTTLKLSPMTGTTPQTTGGATSTTPGSADITGQVLPGDIISIKYTDNKDAGGARIVTSKVIRVMSADPLMTARSNVTNVGEAIEFTVADADANRDGEIIDSMKVKVTSDSDPVGFDITGLETGVNSGVFTFTVQTSATVSSGALVVARGENVYAKYTDAYPADYVERKRQVNDPSKDFILTIPIGATISDVNSTTPTKPALKNIDGSDISEVTTGNQVILSSTVQNNNDVAQPFAAIVEVRNEDGVTVYLQWQTGTLQPNGDINIGLSWTPQEPGTYTVRTFVLSSISEPQVLSPVSESEITVS